MLVLARSPRQARSRVINSLALFLISIAVLLVYTYGGVTVVRQVFLGASFLVVMISAFAGCSSTADSIAKEKRDGTLGLLIITSLKTWEIAAGKLIAGALPLAYAFLFALPLFSSIIILGGISWAEVLSLGVVALNVCFLSANIGLYTSAVYSERKKAQGRSVLIILFFLWILPVAAQFLSRAGAPPWLQTLLGALSLSSLIFNPAGAGAGFSLSLTNLITVHLLGWIFFFLTVIYLPLYWREHTRKPRAVLRDWWRQVAYGKSPARARLRRKLIERNAFFWLASRDRTRFWNAWLSTLLIAGMLLLGFLGGGNNWLHFGLLATVVITVVHQVMWTSAAGMQLLHEHEQGTMELILCTPLTPQRIMHGQFLALLRQFSGPVLLNLTVQLVLVVMLWRTSESPASLALAGYSLMVLFNLWTLFHLGMWFAVSVRDPRHAAGSAFGQGFFLPILGLLLYGAGMSLFNYFGWPVWEFSMWQIFVLWFVLQPLSNSFWTFLVRKKLPEKMRLWAARRYIPEPERSFWSKLLRRKAPPASPAPAMS